MTFDKSKWDAADEQGKRRIIAEKVQVHCSWCPDQGWFVGSDADGEAEQVQCEFCYTTITSKFNLARNPDFRILAFDLAGQVDTVALMNSLHILWKKEYPQSQTGWSGFARWQTEQMQKHPEKIICAALMAWPEKEKE